jgi:hypothetical protein
MEELNFNNIYDEKSNKKLSVLAYKYHMSNVLKDKYIFLFGNVPQQFIQEIENLKNYIISIEPNYFNQKPKLIDSQLSCNTNIISESNKNETEYGKISSTPLPTLSSVQPIQSNLSITTYGEKFSTAKTVSFTSQIRDLYDELLKKQNKNQEQKIRVCELTPNKRFLSPRDHNSNKADMYVYSTSSDYSQQYVPYNRKLITYFDQTLDGTTITEPLPIPLNGKDSFRNSSFASRLLSLSCIHSPTYEEHLVNKSKNRLGNFKIEKKISFKRARKFFQ